MIAIKSARWILFLLFIVSLAAYPLIDRAVQDQISQKWETVFKGDLYGCDLSQAQIVEDPLQRIWIYGSGECDFYDNIHIYEDGIWREIPLGGNPYSQMNFLDKDANLWRSKDYLEEGKRVGVEISRLEGERWVLSSAVNLKDLDDRYTDFEGVFSGPDGQIWIRYLRLPPLATPSRWGIGWAVFKNSRWRITTNDTFRLLSRDIQIIGPWWDEQKQAWFLEPTNLIRSDGLRWRSYDLSDLHLSGDDELAAMAIDAKGIIWLASKGGYLTSGDGEKWNSPVQVGSNEYESTRELATHGQVRSLRGLAVDPLGRIWMFEDDEWSANVHTLDSEPIMVLDGSTWTTLTHENSGLPEKGVSRMTVDSAGNIWISTHSGILRGAPGAGSLTASPLTQAWLWMRGKERTPLGPYWLIPLLLFLAWFVFVIPTANRLPALGLMISGLPPFLILVLILGLNVVFGKLGNISSAQVARLPWQVMGLIPWFSLAGVTLSIVALIKLAEPKKRNRRMAVAGILVGVLAFLSYAALYVLAALSGF